ncbi:MAG: polyprenyl synthetase family protein [Nonlabens sp.]|nr:polyprenyl synthetase family protein [Nonlabens sp.]MDP5101888.1 polyprenyl synthetase family protein [Nonlabens sp.]
MENLNELRAVFLEHLKARVVEKEPAGLYNPVHYILDLGGKRLRPLLTLLAGQIYGAPVSKTLDAALAVEVFHNFTLLHDDIMDAAHLRRGKETVHVKWNENTGILSGDAMLIMSYKLLESYDVATFKPLMSLFSRTALQVCEGQQYDVDFETRSDVTVDEYLHMISYKTSVLVGCALQMGAIIAGASQEEQERIYNYGLNLGLAFQLMDDYLDAYGDPATFGKEVGGDIRENKKTYLYLKSIENESYNDALLNWFAMDYTTMDEAQITEKKNAVKELFKESGGAAKTLDAIDYYTQLALNNIKELAIDETAKQQLKDFSLKLMNRAS